MNRFVQNKKQSVINEISTNEMRIRSLAVEKIKIKTLKKIKKGIYTHTHSINKLSTQSHKEV